MKTMMMDKLQRWVRNARTHLSGGVKANYDAETQKRIIKKSDGVDYISDFIARVNLPSVKMHNVVDAASPCYYIRHDVDHDLETAVKIGRAEAELGVTSTYFLLTPGSYGKSVNYYGHISEQSIIHDRNMIDKCKTLQDLGHDIGFHNDLVPLSFKLRRSPGDILAGELEYFYRNGIVIRGTAAHGNPLCRELEFNNKEVFKGCYRQNSEEGRELEHRGWTVKLHSLELSEYGLEYEAYSLPRDSRISDSGGKWRGVVAGRRPEWDVVNSDFRLKEFRELIDSATVHNGVKYFQIMTHPIHWREV
jgi:hypothetical protein